MIIRKDSIKSITESLNLHEIDYGPEVGRIGARLYHKESLNVAMTAWQLHHDEMAELMGKLNRTRYGDPAATKLQQELKDRTKTHTKLTNQAHEIATSYAAIDGRKNDVMSIRALAASHMFKDAAYGPHHFINHLTNFMTRRVQPLVPSDFDEQKRLKVELSGDNAHEAAGHIKSLLKHHDVGNVEDHKIVRRENKTNHSLLIATNRNL